MTVIKYSKQALFLLAAACTCVLLAAAAGHAAQCIWVDTSGEAAAENMTPEETRQTALNRARIKAVEGVSGIGIQGSTLVQNYTLVADFIRTLSAGYVLDEKVIGWDSRSYQETPQSPPMTVYKVRLQSCVAAAGKADPFFKVKGELNRPVFVAGEEAVIKATCTKDCYLTILNVTADDKIRVLMPNKFAPSTRFKAGECCTFPQNGLALEMSTLPGHKKDAEAFYLIATKEKLNLAGITRGDGEIRAKDLYQFLLSLPPDSKAEEMLVYEVRVKD